MNLKNNLEQKKSVGGKEITFYYFLGASALLIFLKFFPDDFFKNLVDFSLSFLPLIIIAIVVFRGYFQYFKFSKEHLGANDRELFAQYNRKKYLLIILELLATTLLFYVLYSPKSFIPYVELVLSLSRFCNIDNYFLFSVYFSLAVLTGAAILLLSKAYLKSQGIYRGDLKKSFKNSLYVLFFFSFFILVSFVSMYPRAYRPIGDYVGNVFYNMTKGDNDFSEDQGMELANRKKIEKTASSLEGAISQTYQNLKNNFSESNQKLATDIANTKASVNTTITQATKEVKNSLSEDINDKLDLSGGTLTGDLTIEDNLTVKDEAHTRSILPSSDDSYDLGSASNGWNNLYVSRLYGSSPVVVGGGSSSHNLSGTDDLIVSGDFEVNGDAYFDGELDLGSNKITNLASPTGNSDAVNKLYVDAQLSGVTYFKKVGSVISPLGSSDSFAVGSFAISSAGVLSGATGNISQWTNDSAYLTLATEADQVFVASPAHSVTFQDITDLGNLSGTNTGDETLSTIKTKLGISTLSGSNTGDQIITLTGDVTGSGTGSFAATLATVNTNVGTFNNLTVNGKGLVTSASNVAYLTSYTETDPIYIASQAYNITLQDITDLGNLSGTNTGDETLSTIKTKLGISVLSGDNTGDNATNSQYSGLATSKQDALVSGTNIKTINTNSLLGAGDISIATLIGYTPYNATNPNNYIALDSLSSTATGLTYTNTTGVFSLTNNYVIPTTTEETNWNAAFGWGNHATQNYFIKTSDTLDNITTGTTNVHLTAALKINYDSAYSHSTVTTNVHGLTFTAEGSGGGLDSDTIDGHDTSYFQTALANPVTGIGTSGYLSKFSETSAIGNSVVYETGGGNVGIGTTSPGQQLSIRGNLLFDQITAPSAPTATINATAGNLNGNYKYRITFVTAIGETEAGTVSNQVSPANQKVDLTNIPISSDPSVIARKIYRTNPGGSDLTSIGLIATLNDNITTTYTDNISSIGAIISWVNTTAGGIYNGANRIAVVSPYQTAFGYQALNSNAGYDNAAFGRQTLKYVTGGDNTAIGDLALSALTSGWYNTAIGNTSLNSLLSGSENIAIGFSTARTAGDSTTITTNSSSVFIGSLATASTNGNTNEIVIGSGSIGAGSNTATLGNTSIVKTILRGNVGIGTTNPTSILHTIASGAKTADYIGNYLTNTATSSTASIIKTGLSVESTGTWNGTTAVNRGLYVNATGGTTNYAAIFEGGNVGIGTTSPQRSLHTTGSIRMGALITGAGGAVAVYRDTNGDLADSTSSIKYKTDINNLEPVLPQIMKLRPVRFKWNSQTSTPGMEDYGMIAEEVDSILPDLVTYNPDGTPRGLKYEKMGLFALKGLQELVSSVSGQQSQITGITNNQNKIVEQLTGQLADQTLSVDNKLQLIGQTLDNIGVETRLIASLQMTDASLQAQIDTLQIAKQALQDQMDLLKTQNKAFNEFLIAFDVSSVDNFAKKNAPLNIFEGKIMASDIEALGIVKAKNIEATDNLKGQNLELGAQVSGTNIIKAGELESAKILTTEAKAGIKLYITPKSSTQGKTLFYDEKDIDPGVGFKVKIDAPALDKDIEFNWLIVK